MPLAFAMGHLLPVAVDIVRIAVRGKAANAPLSGKAEALVDAGAVTRTWALQSLSLSTLFCTLTQLCACSRSTPMTVRQQILERKHFKCSVAS